MLLHALSHLACDEVVPGDADPEYDLQGHEAPRWNNHSWRRFGDKVARDSARRSSHRAIVNDLKRLRAVALQKGL